jgi:hypothetical protein
VESFTVVAAWRDQNPDGTAEQLVAALGSQFHRDYGPVLSAVLFATDRHRAREVTRHPHHQPRTPAVMKGSHSGPVLGLMPDEPDQVLRLREFRAAYPGVIIGTGEFGTWQARIPEDNGETVTTRYTLKALLDRLDFLLDAVGRGEPPGQAG